MIKNRIKNIGKISFLILVRQSWKLIANVYNLLNQPFLTIKKLVEEKDKSQIFLICSMTIMPIIGYISARIIWDLKKYGFMVNSVGKIFAIVITLESLIFLYLGYWTYRVWKRK